MSNATTTEPVIVVTESAAAQILHLQSAKTENAGKHLRVFVEAGGCSGMQYGMVFDEKRPNDHEVEIHGVCVLVDAVSADHLRGSVVDYHDGLNSAGFKITNPNARENCGCGKSFKA
jgi:iron-sulfur cluster assembly protein/iron-sulfur cluster insertion protein